MATITDSKAYTIASHWHGGQFSALYSLCSSKEYYAQHALWFRFEVYKCIQHEHFSLHSVTRTQKQLRELTSLVNWLKKQEKALGLVVEDKIHPLYGYYYPHLVENGGHEVDALVLPR